MEAEKLRRWVGLDVSKETFVAALDFKERFAPLSRLKTKQFPRTKVGVGSCLKWMEMNNLAKMELCVIMETTGCYSKELTCWFYEQNADLHITIQNGRMISDFIKSLNLNKTDVSDAQAIARFGSDRNPPPTKREAEKWITLREYERERTALIENQNKLENRSDSLFSPITRKINSRAIAALAVQIKAIDKEIEKLVRSDEEMLNEVTIMSSMPGVAFVSAVNLLAEYGSLKQYTSRELSKISGLAPRLVQSGSSVNKSYLGRRGSKRGRQILYLDSISSVRKIPFLNDLFERIVARGKCKMTARCACMRKMLLILRAMVASNQMFNNNFLEKFRKTA